MTEPRLPRATWALLGLLFTAAVFAAFWPALSAGFQEGWDDNMVITENTRYRGFSTEHLEWMFTTGRMGHWQPLTWISYAVDHAIWEMDPFGYHLTNLILHALNALLFFALCRGVLRAAKSPAADLVWPSAIAALLFAVHPLRVESVAWVTERRDVLTTSFLFLTMIAWLRYTATDERRWYWIAVAWYVPALLSKAWGITLPAVLLVLDFWPLARVQARGFGRMVLEKVPFAALAGFAAYKAYTAQHSSGAMHYVDFTGLQVLAQASFGLWFYPLKSLWPVTPLPVYALEPTLDPGQPVFAAAMLGVALLAVALIALVVKRRALGFVVACLIYAGVVSPVLGFTQSGVQLVAERYSYLSILPFLILIAAGLPRLASLASTRAVQAGAAIVLVLLGWRAYTYTEAWESSRTLNEYAVAADPDDWFSWSQLGSLLREEGELAEALVCFDKSIALSPDFHKAFEDRAPARWQLGDHRGALEDIERAIELTPGCFIPYVNRGSMRSRAGDWPGARADFETALRIHDVNPTAWFNLGSARLNLSDPSGAIEAYERALEQAAPGGPLAEEAQKQLIRLGAQAP